MHLVFCLGGSLSSRSTSVQREGWECLWSFIWGALPLLLLLRGRAKWELPARCRPPLPTSPTWLSLPNSHRTFHDVGIRERLRGLAPACYPPMVPVLRIEEHGRIREPGLEGVALVGVAVVPALAPALAPLPVRGQEVESVDAGCRPRRSLLVPARAESSRGSLTATALGVGALGLDVTGLYPRIDTGHAVNGRGLLTATGRAVSVRVPLPAGEIVVTARGRPLSRIARVTARGQAGRGTRTTGQTRNPGGCGGGCLAASCGF